jgi:hypothetical protein
VDAQIKALSGAYDISIKDSVIGKYLSGGFDWLSEDQRLELNDAGYADSVFAKQSKIDAPGYRINMGSDKTGMVDAPGVGGIFNMDTSESLNIDSAITRLKDF